MFEKIITQFGLSFINGFLDKALAAFQSYNSKQISLEELKDRLYGQMVEAARSIDAAHSDALKATYAAFMGVMEKVKIVQRVWAFVVISQAVMIVWFQLGIPWLTVAVRHYSGDANWHFPSSGSTADWAYLLVAACLGMAPVVLSSGPGATGSITDKLKAMIGK